MIERNLVALVVLTAALGLAVPAVGTSIEERVAPLFAVLMLVVSMTFDVHDLRLVARRPGLQAIATALVYVPMGIVGALLSRVLFGAGTPYGLGQTLVGVLPTDISSPLLVFIARGNVALATVLNAVNTALAPLLVPVLFVVLTGVELTVPVGALMVELLVVILVPTLVGVWLRTRYATRLAPAEPLLSAAGSIVYLVLLLAVLGPNAEAILDSGWDIVLLVAGALALNLVGYAFGAAVRPWVRERADRTAFLFTVSKKEFSIAAVVVVSSGLPSAVAVPAVVTAVVQMITSPIAARRLAGRAGAGEGAATEASSRQRRPPPQ